MTALTFSPVLRPLVAALVLGYAATASGQAMPLNPSVINGTAVVNSFSNGMQVINSPGAIIHWDSFSIGNGRTVRFDQVTSQSAVLNRVTGGSHSEILGTLQSNGRVFLLNPNGIVFGAGSRVDVAGLLASTLNMSDADFLAGNYRFSCFNAIACEAGVDVLNPYNNRIVLRDGSQITTRTAGEGGQVWLIARDRVVSEKGSRIEAPTGQVMAAAAREVTITSPALGQMSFTLTGAIGSAVDLAGDIDVPRGAAGFFADTVRLAGKVHARSDAGAAGQILARAATELRVEGDARLDVSGTGTADAGAIRLTATQRVRVAASAEIAADGASAGGQGGLITLEAAEVILPALLGSWTESPVQIHARGFDADGLALARYGRVDVRETGTFEYTVADGPTWTGQADLLQVRTDRSSPTSFNNDSSENYDAPSIAAMAVAGDGQVLLVTLDYGNDREFHYAGSGGQTTGNTQRSMSEVYQVRLLDAQGQLVATRALSSASQTLMSESDSFTLPVRSYSVVGLSKGGWVVRERGDNQRVHVISAQSANATVIDVSSTATLRAMLSGGFIVEDVVGGASTRVVYTASGERVSDNTAAASLLAGENLSSGLAPMQGLQNFDERRGWRVSGGALQYIDRVDETVERTGALPQASITGVSGSIGTSLLGNRVTVLTGDASSYRQEVEFGAIDGAAGASGAAYVPLMTDIERRNNSGQLIARTSSSIASSVDRVSVGPFVALGGGALGYVETTLQSTSSTVRQAQAQSVTDTTTTEQTNSVSFNRVQRALTSAPAPAQNVTGTVFAPLLLASLPGASNGVVEAGGGGVIPPVDPGTPVTPPGTPPGAGSGNNNGNPSGSAAQLELPPPPSLPGIRPPPPVTASGPTPPPPGLSVPAAVATSPAIDELGEADTAELLEAARDVVRDLLGPRGLAKFDAAESPRERGAVLTEAAYALSVGPELYAATEFMGAPMRNALYGTMSEFLGADALNDRDLSKGLLGALTVKRESTNPDGTPGVPRTRLENTLLMLEVELAQADSLTARNRVKARIMREMVIAARQEEGDTIDEGDDVVVVKDDMACVRITSDGDVIRE